VDTEAKDASSWVTEGSADGARGCYSIDLDAAAAAAGLLKRVARTLSSFAGGATYSTPIGLVQFGVDRQGKSSQPVLLRHRFLSR